MMDSKCKSSAPCLAEVEDVEGTALSTSNIPSDAQEEEEQVQIHHGLHPQHPLSLYLDEENFSLFESPNCKLCSCECYTLSYGCVQCGFLLHKLCAELPSEFPCPSHPSQPLRRQDEYQEFECGSCSSTSLGFPYRCESCSFNLDFGCVFFREMNEDDLYQLGRYDGFKCYDCAKGCTGAVIGCPDYGYFIHESCHALPECIQHPSHPTHPLRKLQYAFQFKCNGCLLDQDKRTAYKCTDSNCTYYLDFECAFLFKGHQLIHLDIHPHLLALTEEKHDNNLYCIICHRSCFGPTYSCPICKFDFHASCMAVEEIQRHPSHPFHHLKRTSEQCKYRCHACHEDRYGKPYRCQDCDFNLDFDCTFVVPRQVLEDKDHCTSNVHRHFLALTNQGSEREGQEVHCSICSESCSSLVHGCGVCDIPNDIQHYLFQGHSLEISLGDFKCSICLQSHSGIHYGCSDQGCKVKLDIKCALGIDRPLITFDGHNHPLVFLENFNGYAKCSACNTHEKLSSMFHCPNCDFNLHLLCGPLPCSLKQEKHLEMLSLKDSLVDEGRISDEFYCHSCEETRDPRECLYYCERCDYAAEIKCIMPELIHALMGKSGDVELRTLGKWALSGKVASRGFLAEDIRKPNIGGEILQKTAFTLGHIMGSLTEDEAKELDIIFDCRENLFKDLGGDGNIALVGFFGSDEDFMQLVARLDHEGLTPLKKYWDVDMSFVQVGNGDIVPEKFIHVYNDLYHKYGDLGAESSLSPMLKSIFFLHMCQAVESMWVITVLDVTEEQLVNWWISLKAVRKAGFKAQFAIDALKLALYAYFGTRATIFESNLNHDIKLLEEKIQEKKTLQGQIESELTRYQEYLDSRTSSTVKECVSEAPPMMYKTASEVVLGLG